MKVVAATPEMVPGLLDRMGAERAAAMAERIGGDPVADIQHNIGRSALTWAGLDDQGVVALGGAIPQGDAAYVWQFVTDGVRSNLRGYLEMSRTMVREGLKAFSVLVAMIETTHLTAIKHCRRNGFEIMPPSENGGVMVHLCVLRRAHV